MDRYEHTEIDWLIWTGRDKEIRRWPLHHGHSSYWLEEILIICFIFNIEQLDWEIISSPCQSTFGKGINPLIPSAVD